MKMVWAWTGNEATLESILKELPAGWHALVRDLLTDLEKLGWNGRLAQVKEKFGSARFYTEPLCYSGPIGERILEFEHQSHTTCEICGAAGTRRAGGWIRILCDSCAENPDNHDGNLMRGYEPR